MTTRTDLAGESPRVLVRYGWWDTRSSAGRGLEARLDPNNVVAVRCWVNSNGNPSYTYRTRDDHTLFLVDDYGGENGITCKVERVSSRSALFAGWVS